MSQAEELSARGIPATISTNGTQNGSPKGMPAAGPAPLRLDELSPQNLYDKCMALARNLWWSWHPEVTNLFRELDPIRWRQLDHNPIALLAEFTPERLEARAGELVLYSRINQAYRRLKEYLANESSWSTVHAGVLGSKPVVYFSAEFGIHESVPIYSGGLGVLAGDHIKSASGLGIPLLAVGLFYDQGYFRQQLDIDVGNYGDCFQCGASTTGRFTKSRRDLPARTSAGGI
jgi:starch phosphorylase